MKKSTIKPNLSKIKDKASRSSLALFLSIFVFVIITVAIALTTLGIWILSKAGVLINIYGDLEFGAIVLFMLFVSLIIGGTLAFFSSKIPLKPISELVSKMNRLAAGDYHTRLELKGAIGNSAVGKDVVTSFNTLAEELENTELLRNDFINNFSHEFKTPIVSITGLAQLLESGNLTEEQRVQYARAIREESMRLSSMASNVLNLTKVENQTILTDVSKFNLSEQVRSSVLLLEDKWTSKDIDLQIDFDEHLIEANEELLKQIWINLIDNAIKFAPHRGTVEIKIAEKADLIFVTVSNTGSEIPKEKQEKIFTKFYQADESHATNGNGIGLAIVKSIVKLHSGEIAVKSESSVTTFLVKLPKNQKKYK